MANAVGSASRQRSEHGTSYSKAKAQKLHARRRALQRHGLETNLGTYQALCERIRSNGKGAIFLFRESRRVTHWAVEYFGEWLPVVYDKQRQTIVTFLPKEALTQYGKQLPKVKRCHAERSCLPME